MRQLLTSLGAALVLNSPCALVDALFKRQRWLPRCGVVTSGESGEGGDVGAGDAEDGELGQSLVVAERRHRPTQCVERRADRVHT